MGINKIALRKFVLMFLTLVLLASLSQAVEATTFRSWCKGADTGSNIACTWNYKGSHSYTPGVMPPSVNAPDNTWFDVTYSSSGYSTATRSMFIDSRLSSCAPGTDCTYNRGSWKTTCKWNGVDPWICQIYYNGNYINNFYLRSNGEVRFVPYLAKFVNSPPILGDIGDVNLDEDSPSQNNLVDLWDFSGDDKDSDSALSFSITSQSNSGLISCNIDSDRYIDCGASALNQFGTNTITVRVRDTDGASRTNSFNIVINPVNDLPTTPTSLNFNSGVYGNNNDTILLTCSGSTDVDSTVYYNIQSNISGSWADLVQDDADGIYSFDISGYSSRFNVGFRCQASDLIGQSNYFTSSNTIEIDDSVPQVSNLISNNVEFGFNGTVLVDVIDSNGIGTVNLSVSGLFNYSMNLDSGNTYEYTFVNPAIGTYNLTIYAYDSYGNLNHSVTGQFNVTDSTSPEWNPIPSNQVVEFGNSFSYDVNATDLQVVSYSVNDSDFNIDANGLITNTTSLIIGTYMLELNATDASGNSNLTNINVTVQDTISPIWNPVPSNQIVELGDAFSYDVNATDLQVVSYSVDDLVNFKINSTGFLENNSALSVGIYILELNATDASGNSNLTNINVTVSDTIVPEVFGLQLSNVEYDGNLTVRVNATDLSGIDSVILELDGTTNYTMVLELGDMYNYTLVSPSVGTHNVIIYVNDSQGNGNDSVTGTFNSTDTTNPEVFGLSDNGPVEYDENVIIDVNATDLTLNSVWVEINGSNQSMTNILGDRYQLNLSGLDVGTYPYTIYANDSYLNLNDSETGIVTIVDTIAPVWNPIPTNQVVEFGNSFAYDVNATDLQVVSYSVNDSDFNIDVNGLITNTTSLVIGVYDLTLNATDSSNNVNSTNVNITVVDTTSPTLVDLVANDVEFDGNVTFNVNVTDLSPIDDVWLALNNGTNYTLVNTIGNTYFYELDSPIIGDYNFTIYANDSYSNQANVTGNFTAEDTTNPLVFALTAPSPVELGDNTTIQINVTDLTLDSVWIEINGSNFTLTNTNGDIYLYNESLVVGTYPFTVYVNDSQNNLNDSVTGSIVVSDTTVPAVFDLITNETVEYDDNVEFYINVTDLSTIANVYLEYNSVNYTMVNLVGDQFNYTLTSPNVGNGQAYTIYAIDSQGNVNDSIVGTFNVTDTTAPEWVPVPSNQVSEFGSYLSFDTNATDLGPITYSLNNTGNFSIDVDGLITNATNLDIGIYQLELNATDSSGNSNLTNINVTISDTITPVWNPIPSNEVVEFGSYLSFDTNATDLRTITYSLNNTGNFSIDANGLIINATSLPIGTYLLHLNATDGFNTNTTNINITVVDSISPIWNPVPSNQIVELGDAFSYDVNATDLQTITYSLNDTTNFAIDVNGLITNATNLSVGIYQLELNVTDASGNSNLTNINVTVSDTIVPEVFGLQLSNVEYDSNLTVRVNATDLSGIASVILELDGTTNYSMVLESGNMYNYSLVSPSVGTHNVIIYVNDSQGNRNDSVTGSFDVTDNTVPEVSGIITNTPVEYDGIALINVTVTDLNLDSVWVEIAGNNYSMTNNSATNFNATITDLAIGSYPFTIYANDSQGNLNDSETDTIVIQDTTVPNVSNLVVSDVEFNNNNLINVTIVDLSSIDLVILELDGTTNYTMSNNSLTNYNLTLVSPSVGVHNIVIYANDTYGNMNDSVTGSFTVTETTAPSVSGVLTNSPIEYDGNATFNVTITDLSNIDSVLVEINGTNYSMSNNSATNYNLTISGLAIGSYPYTIYANDTYGNMNDSVNDFIVVNDSLAPQWSPVPSNQTIELGDSFSYNVDAIDLRTVSYSVNDSTNFKINSSGSLENNTVLAVGIYQLALIATDGINDNVTNINVSVEDTTVPAVFDLIVNETVEYDDNVEFYINVTDLSTISNVYLEYAGSNRSMSIFNLNQYNYTLVSPNVGDNQVFTIYAIDNSGNVNGSINGTFNVTDITTPQVSNIQTNSPVEFNGEAYINATVTDLNLDSVWVEIDGSNNSMSLLSGDIFNVTVSGLGIGSYSFTIYANDSYGNLNDSETGTIIISDTTSPVLADLIAADVEFDGNVTFSINVTDLSSISDVWLSLNNGSNYSLSNIVGNTYSYELESPLVGFYLFTIYANDSHSNLANITGNFTATDSTNPSVFALVAPTPVELGDNVTLQVNVTDLTLADSWIEINGSNYSLANPSGDIYNITLSGFGVGTYPFTVYVNDSQNNLNDSVTGSIVVSDTTVPAVFDLITNETVEYDDNVEFYINVTDLSTISNVYLWYAGVNYSMSNLGGDQYNYTLVSPNVGDNQPFWIFAIDSQGNENMSVNGLFNVTDLTMPDVFGLSDNGPIEFDGNVNITVNVTDLNLDSVWVEINGNNLSMTNLTSEIFNITISGLAIGTYPYTIYGNDSYGNLNNSVSSSVIIQDTTVPTVLDLNVNNIEFDDNALINVTVSDLSGVDLVILELDGTTNYTMSNNSATNYNLTLISPNVGTHNFVIYTNDSQGNRNDSVVGSFNVTEITAPSVTNVIVVSPIEYDGNVIFNATVTDLSDVDSVLVEINGTNYSMSNNTATNYNLTITGLNVGTYPYTIYANDSYNNLNGSVTGSIVVQDTIVPEVFGLQLSNVEYDGNLTVRVNATDLSGIASVILELDGTTNYTMVLESGEMYNYTLVSPSVGTHNIVIYANDSQGNRNDSVTGSFDTTDSTAPQWSSVPSNQTVELGDSFSYDVDATDLRTVSYSINNSDFTINSSGLISNTSSLSLRVYMLELNASDGVNDNLTNINISVVDTTSPVWSPIPSNQIVELGNDFSYDVDATDLQVITYAINNTDNFSIDVNGLITNATSLNIGTYMLNINATDASGNVNSTNINVTVGDNVAPVWSPVPTNQNVEFGNDFSYDVNATDLGSIVYSINNTDNFSIDVDGLITNATSLNLGSYPIELNATDSSGNINSTIIIVTVGDGTNPDVFDLNYTNTVEYNNNLTIYVNVTDLNAIASVLLEYESTNYSMNDEGNDRYNYTLISPNSGNDQIFTIYAIDNSGNINDSVSGSFNVTDTITPEWNPVPSNQTVELGDVFSYDVNATDLSTVVYGVNNSDFAIDVNGLLTNATDLSVGIYMLELNASDNINDNLTNINVSVVDTTAPDVTNSIIPLTVFSNQTFNISVDVNDFSLIDEVVVGINNGSNETNYTMSLDSGNTYNLTLVNYDAGSYNVVYYVNDTYGNLNDSLTDSFTVVASNSAPSITSFTPLSSTFEEGDLLNVTVIATDSDSTPVINLSVDGNLVATSASGTLNYLYNFTNTDEGSYNYTACATDGIEVSCSLRTYNVTDKAIPDLTNVTPTGTVFGSSQTILVYPDRDIDSGNFVLEVNGIDVTGSASATATNITYDGTSLPAGINTVNVTATDLVGNTQSYNWSFIIDLTSQVSGYVLDVNGDGIGSANVEVAFASNGTVIGDTNTYVSGSWINSFELDEGNYTFTVSAPNYVTNVTNISIDGTDQEINFTLVETPNVRVATLSHVPSFEVEYQDVTFTAGLLYDGKFDDNVNVSLYIDGTYVTSQDVSIVKENITYNIDLIWTNATVGTYDFVVNVSGLDKETYLSDNEAYETDIDVVPIEDVLSLGIRNVPSFDLPTINLSNWNVYTDVISSSAVDLYNIPLTFVNGTGITLNNGSNSIVFNITAGETQTNTWDISLLINSSGTIDVSNVTALIYDDIVLSKNFTTQGGVGIVN